MGANFNALRWGGAPGHYEVYYLSATDRATGLGFWIRYTMVAPVEGREPATCSLWLMAMDPAEPSKNVGRKVSFPIDRMVADADPFSLRIEDSVLTDEGMTGGFEDVAWDLTWKPGLPAYRHVNPLLQRAKVAKTVLVLPHADLAVTGTLTLPGREPMTLEGARGGQAHLWGSKHATRWAWAHCNDFVSEDGEDRDDTFLDAVSVFVPRLGREMGPSTPLVGRFDGRDFLSTQPFRVLRNPSRFGLTSWEMEAQAGDRKLVVEVDADRDQLVGVTYHDPDGDLAYCYNTETATMRVGVYAKSKGLGGWSLTDSLVSKGRAHYEYAQREPLDGLPLHVR